MDSDPVEVTSTENPEALLLAAADLSRLGNTIRRCRRAINVSQRDLAGTQASSGYISRIESGQRRPSLTLLQTIADRLDVTVESLLTGTSRSSSLTTAASARSDPPGGCRPNPDDSALTSCWENPVISELADLVARLNDLAAGLSEVVARAAALLSVAQPRRHEGGQRAESDRANDNVRDDVPPVAEKPF